jgi:Uma2 family endonuclease
MATELSRILVEIRYHAAAQDYLRKLPLEHFMEATPQATQREITLESLTLVRAQRSDFHLFNELLVQYPLPRRKQPGQVVPDNMVVLHNGPIKAEGSYDVPLQPAPPFWVLEYLSKNNRRKDYDDNMRRYEHELKVPYYLLFVADEKELTLYHHTGEKYVSVKPNEQGRLALQELDLEVGLHEGWVRYWYRSALLPLPPDLLQQLEQVKEQLQQAQEQIRQAERRAEAAEAELARLRAELERLRRSQGEDS